MTINNIQQIYYEILSQKFHKRFNLKLDQEKGESSFTMGMPMTKKLLKIQNTLKNEYTTFQM